MLSLALVVLKDKVSVLGPGLGLEPRVLVNITDAACSERDVSGGVPTIGGGRAVVLPGAEPDTR